MGFLTNLLNIKVAQTFLNLDEAKKSVKEGLQHSETAIFRNVPLNLIEELSDCFESLDEVDISINADVDPPENLKRIAQFYRNKQNTKIHYYGQLVEYGNIFLARAIYDVIWFKAEIFEISAVTYHECLSCHGRTNLWFEEGLDHEIVGDVLNLKEGWQKIIEEIVKADKVVINNIPDYLLEDLAYHLDGKEVKVLIPHKHRVHPIIARLPGTRTSRGVIHTYTVLEDGSHAHVGGIALPHIHYGIAWDKQLVSIRTACWKTCIKCMTKAHLTNWKLGKRIGRLFY